MIRIGIDLDGTLSESIENILSPSELEKFRGIYNKIRIREPKIIRGRIIGFVIHKFFDYKWKHWKKVKMLSDDIPEIIEKLSKITKILIITSTSGKREYVENWLKNNRIIYDDIIFAPPNEKWKYCDILVDDRFDVIFEAVKSGIIGILLSKKEKANHNGSLIIANSWEDIFKIIVSINQKMITS